MSVLDKFLNAIRLNDDYDDEDEFFDEDDDIDDEEFEEEAKPKKRFFQKIKEKDEAEEEPRAAKKQTAPKQQAAAPRPVRVSSPKVTPMRRKASGSGMEVCVIKPNSMEDTREIADTLLANCTVVLNLEGIDVEVAQRIIDFACGAGLVLFTLR